MSVMTYRGCGKSTQTNLECSAIIEIIITPTALCEAATTETHVGNFSKSS